MPPTPMTPQPMNRDTLPIKKAVSFEWRGQTLAFDVAQALFSSHQVDRGSRQLLESLDPETFPAEGTAVDFGCGYGVLGIAWQTAMPGWSMDYLDRDALAVAFSRHNVARLPGGSVTRARFSCDISVTPPDDGYDLVLWNVPGKAGRPVIAELCDVLLDALAPSGVLALVVVHPLADLFVEALDRADGEATLVERGKEHTVVHLRRIGGEVIRRDPFEEGLFDRPTEVFEAAGLEWMLTPAIGLPEYDSLNHATELAIRAMTGIDRDVSRWLVVEPGAGHLVAAAFLRWPAASGVIAGRDALALRASHRAVGGVLSITEEPAWGVPAVEVEAPVDLAVVALPEQAHPDELSALLDDLAPLIAIGGEAILHGRSTEVARVGAVARKRAGWRMGPVAKLRGSASVVARHT
jgi:16S rRNA (guanine1207-N2)-methyltransferase